MKTHNWKSFYKLVRGKDWPDCHEYQDLRNLPLEIQQEIFFQHLSFLFDDINEDDNTLQNSASTCLKFIAKGSKECELFVENNNPCYDKYYNDNQELPLLEKTIIGNIEIEFHPEMECGGIQHVPTFLEVINMLKVKTEFDHCLEWCSGPGFVGFGILDAGLCKKLDLADIWKPALDAAKKVKVKQNIKTWHIKRLSDIQNRQKYDLIVGNPPWVSGNLLDNNRKLTDLDLQIHKNFFKDVKEYLTNDGVIILIESRYHTGPGDFLQMIKNSNLELSAVLVNENTENYFMVVKHSSD